MTEADKRSADGNEETAATMISTAEEHNMFTDGLGASSSQLGLEEEEVSQAHDLETIQDAVQTAVLAIKTQREPIRQLRLVVEALKDAVETDRMGSDPAFAKYINERLGARLMQNMSKETSVDDEYLEVCADVQESYIRLFLSQLRRKRFHNDFICAITWCFQPQCKVHSTHFQFTREELKHIAMSHQTWRKEIAIDSIIDIQITKQSKMTGWMQGKVVDGTGDLLSVRFDDAPPSFDKMIDRWSTKVAQSGTKTTEDYEWRRQTLHGATDVLVDCFDGTEYLEATIFETKMEEEAPGRFVEYAYVAFRVYRSTGKKMREDERGVFDGWSKKYDEWIPIYGPQIVPHQTASQGKVTIEENDEELDSVIQPSFGFERVYAVPRIYSCISKKFLYFMDMFGNEGGFDLILEAMENQELDDKNLTLTAMCYMITLISMPSKLWQKGFIEEYGERFCRAITKRLIESNDDKIRELDMTTSQQAVIAVGMILNRVKTRVQAHKQREELKLKFIKKCLESQYLEKRIQGIKELNEIIGNTTTQGESQLTQDLISWVQDNQVFTAIWDPKKTHLQLVQRSGDIFRMLLKEDLLSEDLLKQFWNLTKSDYKLEIFKILNDCEYMLEQPQIEFIFDQITLTPATKLGIEEFDVLSMLGRICKLTDFSQKVSMYFWRIICDSETYNQELLDQCVSKFSQMIKYSSIGMKKPFFVQLAEFLQSSAAPTIPVLRLFQKIISDHKDRERLASKKTTGSAGGINYGNVPKWAPSSEPVEVHQVFEELEESHNFSEAILKNLASYFSAIAGKEINEDRSELHLVSEKYSHHDEVDERLKFLQTYAANSSFELPKQELKVIYDLLGSSPVKGDLEELLKWCKSACENVTDRIVDLNAIGEFFAEQISNNILDLKSMPTTGFHLIQMFYVNSNANANNILKQEKPKKKKKVQKFSQWDTQFYGNLWNEDPPKDDEQDEDNDEEQMPFFTVYSDPDDLLFIDMVWSITLESQVEAVHKAATSLLVFSYLSLDTSNQSEDARYASMQTLLAKCFELIDPKKNPSTHTVTRVNQVIKEVIQQSETRGDCGIRPHRSILKGELLDRVLVKFMGSKNVWGEEKLERAIVIKLYTSCTVWEFKSEVAKLLGLAPKYLEFELADKELLNDKEHGKDMQQLDLKNNAIITARKCSIKESIPQAALVDLETQWLTPKAEEIFTEWFNMFKNPIKKKMDNFSVARFISKTTKTSCISSEQKVQELIQSYDSTQDGCLDLQEFLQFYYDAASQPGDRRQACFKNLKNLNVRPDLVKLSDVIETSLFGAKQLMPRFALQANEAQYQTLWKLLERNDETCADTWELIRMLATNEKQYMEVIRMDSVTDEEGQVDWNTFFKGSSEYQKSYLQEIILSVLEDSEQSESSKRVMFVSEQKITTTHYGTSSTQNISDEKAPGAPTVAINQEAQEDGEEIDSEESKKEAEITALRLNWSRNFLERGGFQHVMAQLYALDIQQGDTKQIEFMMTLVRVFLTAAFATDTNKHIGKAIKLARKSSSIDDSDNLASKAKKEVKRDPLQELLNGEYGMEILLSTNYDRLQQKILTLVFSILEKAELTLNEKIIVENALSVQVGSLLYRPELFNDFLAFKHGEKGTEDFILSGLVTCKEEKIRQDFYQGVLALASSLEGETKLRAQRFFIGVLGKNFNRIADVSCTQYFDLFNDLIDLQVMQDSLTDEIAQEDAPYDPKTLLGQIIDKIIASQRSKAASEDQQKPVVIDEVTASEIAAGKERSLVGLITLTRKIMQTADTAVSDQVMQEKNLIDLLFKDFLFASHFQAQKDKVNGVKKEIQMVQRVGSKRNVAVAQVTSNNRSREAAFSLLIELVKKSGLMMENFLEKVLLPMLMSVEKPKKWAYTPQIKENGEGSVQEYVGLRNLGCICYMNSMMQQFFMIPALRYNLLCVDDGKPEELVEYKGKRVDDNMFHQMQKLFAHLELSQRTDYNPFGFCFAFKEFDGGPTNTSEQKDAQEFLNVFLDRLETSLKPTSRKYLLEGIFGGKQCSQMVCTECGKVKNRHEVFYNLSLNIKDIKQIHESLAKQVEGEIISDYQCDGCNRKVDLSKRTLIAETPNVLIVHLQRIVFNFDTFENDKVNTLAKFPTMLDLKPYSYFEVMGKENRLNEEEEAASSKPKKDEEDVLTEEEINKKKEEEEEKREPIREDCFEYKLVGVNVHSGTANMGHYWSYINTNRGVDEDKDPNWVRTEADPWMEFNDSRVSNWDFKEIEKECFGNEAGQSFMGDSYGTSGYMLFYERRIKKDLKILVEEAEVEAEKAKGTEVQFDEEKKEHFKMLPYRKAADGEKPNPIYQQVFEDNHSVSFENDVYSQEFFDFVLQIMKGVADSDSSTAKETGLEIGKKVGFEILSRCYENSGLKHLQVAMIDILKSSDKACLDFMRALLDDDDCEPVMEILFSCPDMQARKNLIRIIRYLVCRLKLIEKDLILANDFEEYEETVVDTYGEQLTRTRTQPISLVLRFMATLKAYMHVRAAKAWKMIDTYTELLFSFGVHSPEDFESESKSTGKENWSRDSEGYQIGMLEYFRNDFLTVIGDFILQDASPLYRGATDYRLSMGNYYIQPDFDTALELITVMISDSEMQVKYPFSENAKKIVQSKDILKQLIKASETSFGPNAVNFANMLNMMCTNNYQFSKKMAKTYIREFLNKNQADDIQKGLKQLRSYLLIKDNLRQVRFEWIFGVPQAYAKRNYQKKTLEIANCESQFINVECTQYKSGVVKGAGDALLTDMFKAIKTRAEFTVQALFELLNLCIEDEEICAYIYNMPPPTHQYARYCDWFESFATNQRSYLIEQGQRYTTYQDIMNKENIGILTQILTLLPTFKEKCAPYEALWKKAREDAPTDCFDGLKEVSMVGTNDEVLDHYPPIYIIGQPIDGMQNVIFEEDIDDVTVKIVALTCEYMYSNPTGLYNLSLPSLKLRNHLNFKAQENTYVEWKKSQSSGAKPDEANQAAADENNDDDEEDAEERNEFEGHDVRLWDERSCVGEVLLRIEITNYSRCQVKIEIGVEQDEEDTTPLNCHLPLTSFFQQIMASNISAKPVSGFIQKIDPTKPFGKIKPTIGVKKVRSAGASYVTGGNAMGGVMGYGVNSSTTGSGYTQVDPTSTQAYKDVVSNIRSGNVGNARSVGFFVSEGNLGRSEEDGENETGQVQTSGRRNGVNLGQIQPIEDLGGEDEADLVIEGKGLDQDGDDEVDSMGFGGYQSDQDRQNENFGSDLEDDLQKL